MLTDLPNLLTLSRIAAIPLVVALLYVGGPWGAWGAGFVFAAACLTDWFDGYLARSWAQESPIGRFLDPIADKLLVSAVLFTLAISGGLDGLTIFPALVILLREVLVSGLREFLAGVQVSVPVSRLAKWKTGIQMTTIGVLMVSGQGPAFLAPIGRAGLWVAAGLTLITGWDYMRVGWKHMMADRPAAKPDPKPASAASDVKGAARTQA